MKTTTKLLTVMLAVLMLCPLFTACSQEFDYMTSDLSEYIALKRDQYTGQTVEIEMPPKIDDAYVDGYIRDEVLSDKGISIYMTDRNTATGDLLGLFYRVTAEVDGKDSELLSNILEEDAEAYRLGSNDLKFGAEFDRALTDLDMTNTLVKKTEGKVKPNQVLYATYSYSYPVYVEEKKEWKTVAQTATTRLDLAELAENGRFGEDFVNNLTDKDIGKKHSIDTKFDANGDGVAEDVIFSITVKLAVEEKPVTFTVTYPDDHELKALAGKTVRFFVCVNGRLGSAKELLTEEIVKETIKYTPKDEDKNSDTVDAYIRDVKELLTDSRQEKIQSDAVDALWEQLRESVNIIALPEDKVTAYYDAMYEQTKSAFSTYNTQVGAGSLDEFIEIYYGVEEGTKHQDYFRECAENDVRDKLIYYTVLRNEGITVTDREIEETRPDVMTQLIYSYTVQYYQAYGTWQSFTEKDMVDRFGEEYILNSVRETLLSQKMETFLYENLTVKEKVAKET